MPALGNVSYIPYELHGCPVPHPTEPLFTFTSSTSCPPLGLISPEVAHGPSRATQAFRNPHQPASPSLTFP